jgi:hypothetical protein
MKKVLYFILVLVILFIGCTSEKNKWIETKKTNTLQNYEAFSSLYPTSIYSDSVKTQMNNLLPVNPKIIKCEIISTKKEDCEIKFVIMLQHRIDFFKLSSKPDILVLLIDKNSFSAIHATVEKIAPINLYTSTISCLSRSGGSSCSGVIEMSVSLLAKDNQNKADQITQNVDFK